MSLTLMRPVESELLTIEDNLSLEAKTSLFSRSLS